MAKAKLNPNPEKGEERLDLTRQGGQAKERPDYQLAPHQSADAMPCRQCQTIVHMTWAAIYLDAGLQKGMVKEERNGNEMKWSTAKQLTIGRLGFFPRGLLVLVVAVAVVAEDDGGDIMDCLLLVLVGNVVYGVAIAISLGWDSYLL